DAVPLVSGVADSTAGTLEYAVSQNGVLITLPVGRTYDEAGKLVLLNRKGERIPFSNEALDSVELHSPKISPDNNKVAGDRNFEVWEYDLNRGTSTRLSSGARAGWPIWSRDSQKVTYASEQRGSWNPFWRSADGSDMEQSVFESDAILNPTSWSPD